MSYWRCLLRDIAEAGGESIQASSLPEWGITPQTERGRSELIRHGLIRPVGGRRHSITANGWRLLAGAADLVEPKMPGKVGPMPRAYSLVVRGSTVPDIVIEDLLIEARLVPGAPISPAILRAYTRLKASLACSRSRA